MNTKSLLLAGLLSFAPALVLACDCDKAQAPVTEEVAVVVADQKADEAKKAVVVASESKEVTAQEVVADATPVTK